MMAGFAAGVTEALCIVTPFEVVKIRLQQQKGMAKDKLLYKVCCAPCLQHADCVSICVGHEGAFCIPALSASDRDQHHATALRTIKKLGYLEGLCHA